MITFTDKGAEKVQEFLDSQSADIQTSGLRVGVRGGGCSGFQYALAFDTQRDGDTVFEDHGLRILVDTPEPALRPGRDRRLRRGPPGRRLQGRQPERHRGLRLRLLLPRRGGGRGLRRLRRDAASASEPSSSGPARSRWPFLLAGEGRARQAAGPADADPDADRHRHAGAGSGAAPPSRCGSRSRRAGSTSRSASPSRTRTSSRRAGPSPSRSRAGATRSGRCTPPCTGSSCTGPRSSRAPAPPPTSTS